MSLDFDAQTCNEMGMTLAGQIKLKSKLNLKDTQHFKLLKRFTGTVTDQASLEERRLYLASHKSRIFIIGFGLYYGGTGRGLHFNPEKFIWDKDSPF